MDVIIPAHNIKILSSSLTALSKIGKQLYIEFDPLTGLTLRTLNDGKSSFAEFLFDVGFFERCTSPPGSNLLKKRVREDINRTRNRNNATNRIRSRRRRRIPRQRSEDDGDDSDATTDDENIQGMANGRNGTRRKRTASNSLNRSNTESNDDSDDDDDDEKYLCRVPIRSVLAILHSRKGLQSLRIRSIGIDRDLNYDEIEDEEQDARMQLSFEFRIQSNGSMKITHKIAVASAESVIASADRTNCSEIIASPKLLLKMVEPVTSPEIALVISDERRTVTATSFHYADVSLDNFGQGDQTQSGVAGSNLVLSASVSKVLKTETTVDCDEFEEYNYEDGQGIELDEEGGEPDLPTGIDREVSLVFSSKEAKALLQFCTQQAVAGNIDDLGELTVVVNFHWGGKPVVFETEGEAFKGTVILSTVSHKLLNGVDLTSRAQKKKSRSRVG